MLKFLVVDDEPLALQDLEDNLRQLRPHAVISGFTSARAALKLARTETFDTAFLDIELGYVSGLFLAKQLKELQPGIHIIFVTSYSQYALDAFSVHATGYLLKPVEPEALERELTFLYGKPETEKRVYIRTFGGFELLVDGKPVQFKRAKAKELLAYLVDRMGSGVTTKEACAILFEDAPYDTSQKNYFQTIVTELKSALKQAGIEEILKKTRNNLAVDVNAFECDSYQFLKGDAASVNQYRGDYMPSYSWAEFSAAAFEGKRI